ncbi:MAG: hypothetical protein ABI587_11075 [Gemmatimonadales bacterium]
MPRRVASLLLLVTMLVLPSAAHAQLGGLTGRVTLPRVAVDQPEKPAAVTHRDARPVLGQLADGRCSSC